VAVLRAHGIEAPLPDGFEGRIFVRPTSGAERAHAVAQFSTVALPADVGDFGGGLVTLMRENDIFATLFEYEPESSGTALFARRGIPRALTADDFLPYVLRRGLVGQSGSQWFFTESGRPFTFYVVLGSHARRPELVPRVNELLAQLAVSPAVGPVTGPVAAGGPWN